jgi:hypothetical protein
MREYFLCGQARKTRYRTESRQRGGDTNPFITPMLIQARPIIDLGGDCVKGYKK